MKICTFIGHQDLENSDVQEWLFQQITQLIEQGTHTFYFGGYGKFDIMAAKVVKNLKMQLPDIQLVLVLPYLDKKWDTDLYDESLYPLIEKVPKRLAILKRNKWMIDASDIVIAYVIRNRGGAFTSLKFARRRKKVVIPYPKQ